MKRTFRPSISTVAFCLALDPSASVTHGVDRVDTDESEIFVLAPFEINAERPWLYTSIDGYEILSLLDSETTRTVAERLSRDLRFAPLFLPETVASRFDAPCALVFQEFDNPEVMAKFRARVPPGSSVEYALFDQGDRFTAFLPETTIEVLLKGRRSGVNTPLTGHLFSHFSMVAPKPPPWYLEGLKLLLRNGRVRGNALTFYGPQRLEPVSIPLKTVLTATSKEINALRSGWTEEHRKYERRSALMVHWGLFSDNGQRREAFMELVAAASRKPITENALLRYLGFGYTELGRLLDRYANTWWRSKRTIELSDQVAQKPLPLISIRPASRAEVARIQGEAYISLARGDTGIAPDPRYLVKAWKTLTDAYQAGDRSPEIKNVYGMLEVAEGNDEAARGYFEEATAAAHSRPRAHFELARLRFNLARKTADEDSYLEAAAVPSVYEPLDKALEAEPPMEAAYQLAIALWTATRQSPTSDQLALLARGARAFPDNIALVLLIASIHRQHGAAEASIELGLLGMQWLGDSPSTRLRRLRATPKAARIYEMATILWTDTNLSPSRSELIWLADGVADFLQWPDLVIRASWLLSENGLSERALDLVILGMPFAEPGSETHDHLLELKARLSAETAETEIPLPPR